MSFLLLPKGVKKIFAIGVYANPPKGEAEEEAQLRRSGGALSSAEARLEHQQARALVKQGLNPSQQRKLERVMLSNRQRPLLSPWRGNGWR